MATVYSNTERAERREAVRDSTGRASIKGPLVFWIGFLIFAVVIQLAAAPLLSAQGLADVSATLTKVASYLVYLPGLLIFPFLVSIWMGERLGNSTGKDGNPLKEGLINGGYAAVIYGITIFIVFLILNVGQSNVLSQIGSIYSLVYLIAIPVPILLVLTPAFAMLAAARKH